MSGLWLPPSCKPAPVHLIRNFGEPFVRNSPQPFAQKNKPPNSGGGGGGKGGSALGAPTNLSATANGSSQIDLTWTDNASGEGGFKVERSANGSTGWVQVGTNAANDTTYSDTGLDAETQYYYRVRAYNGSRNGGYSNVDDATTSASFFQPSIADYNVIYDASIGLFQTNGGAAATADGDRVGQWVENISARNLLQATAAKRGTLKLNRANGHPAVRFDATVAAFMKAAAFTWSQNFHLFMVASQWTTNGGVQAFMAGESTSNCLLYNGSVNGRWAWNCGTADLVFTPASATAFHIIELKGAGASSRLKVDDGATQTGNAGSQNLAGLSIGGHANDSLHANIDLAYLVGYAGVLSDGDATTVRNELNARFATF